MKLIITIVSLFLSVNATTQQWPSGKILLHLKKLQVNATVLYIAAHPDDENTRLIAYLANERLYNTAYLSLTRGDGGQNLIGSEQGEELGLIRTQELLAARRIDGALQYFSSAYDFGYSKTSEETFNIWNKQQTLADVVWIIRSLKPDVIITRFPEDTRAGHGHHAASAILAREAYFAAADPNQFPQQLQQGVTIWQAKRIIWNTFNFGSVASNTTNNTQLKLNVGGYNTLLGKSYGELAAESRSQHKSQGFGVPSQRGTQYEYFLPIAGDTMITDIMDGINVQEQKNSSAFTQNNNTQPNSPLVQKLIDSFDIQHPEKSIPLLIALKKTVTNLSTEKNRNAFTQKINTLIIQCIGLYTEASTNTATAVQGDSLAIQLVVNSRLQSGIILKNIFYDTLKLCNTYTLTKNENTIINKKIFIPNSKPVSQPYWLKNSRTLGNFNLASYNNLLQPDGSYEQLQFVIEIMGELLILPVTLQYKHTDPVLGELFQPLYITPTVNVNATSAVVLQAQLPVNPYTISITANKNLPLNTYNIIGNTTTCDTLYRDGIVTDSLQKNKAINVAITKHPSSQPVCNKQLSYSLYNMQDKIIANTTTKIIQYNHIPTIVYQSTPTVKFVTEKINIKSTQVAYIAGAGDKLPEALTQLGYKVTILTQNEINIANLSKYKAIITGVRAYNTQEWLGSVYDTLMQYIAQGGNLIVQYNTNNVINGTKVKIAPFPFTISRNRITNEKATVTYTNPNEIVFTKPNLITPAEFTNWVQERSVYEATEFADNYRSVITMNDDKEAATSGSLIIAPYQKGNFVYCSLALFRQLPAGVTGAYKLLANLVELPINTISNTKINATAKPKK